MCLVSLVPGTFSVRCYRQIIHCSSFQAYEAKLRIGYFASVDPKIAYDGLLSSVHLRAMRIAEITLLALVDDTRTLVSEGVRKDISRRISEADADDRTTEIAYGERRESFLRQWLATEYPLSYDDGPVQTFTWLIFAVMSSPSALIALKTFETRDSSPSAFVDLLIDMSSPLSTSPLSPVAPVVKNGAFLPLLKEAHSMLISLSAGSDAINKAFVSAFFTRAISHLRILYIPSYPNRPPGSGR